MARIAILGAGLTGLSAAHHLRDDFDLFEREADVGGLCRTMRRGGFLFDYTGHLLHLRSDDAKRLIQELAPDGFAPHRRKAQIYTRGRFIEYPFQANLSGMPPDIVKECILGFLDALHSDEKTVKDGEVSFQDWTLRTFGAGVAKYFMFPYNQKLWQIPLHELGSDWVSWSIPRPTLDEFLNGALGIRNRDFGYNPTFLYPKTGGIDLLPRAFAERLPAERLHLEKTAVRVDELRHEIAFADGTSAAYRHLISTLPLPRLIAMLVHAPKSVRDAARRLRAIAVQNVNIGVSRANLSDQHWLYFPEPEFCFYRVGFPTNFSASVAPAGCGSMYVEISAQPDETIPEDRLREDVIGGLRRCGILRPNDDILVWDVTRIENAYVLYDFNRAAALSTIFPYLREHGIISAGRYGAWEYDSMEGAILAGKAAADASKN